MLFFLLFQVTPQQDKNSETFINWVSIILNMYILLYKNSVAPLLGVYKCRFYLYFAYIFTIDAAFFTHDNLATLVFCNLESKNM